ncbi:hypothetical protein [Kineosporia babensis]|uniref:Guanylate cyclase domain-containing protein n=1 Tax=Kineosporia babensis TaxID=499548 RepID=A0A9X1SVV2_9ACTN|nr:hypothetical protein [Kineosporia babensis]MCD5313270.1 hypothetical protein [Kineosporia babensis]
MTTPSAAHYWIVVLDIENFSARSNPLQFLLREAMHRLVRTAVRDTYFEWDELGVKDEGDGMILFFPTQVQPIRIVSGFVDRLHEGLIEARSIYSAEHEIRFRVALHHGMATADESGFPGQATNTACRLVDAELLRTVLTAAAPTPLAVIASDDFYRTVIRPGDRAVKPDEWACVTVDLKKAPGTPAWINVPGQSTPPGLAGSPPPVITLPAGPAEPEQSAMDARGTLLADAGRVARQSGDDGLLYPLEMLSAELSRPDPSDARIVRSLAQIAKAWPALTQDPRLNAGFGGLCDLTTLKDAGKTGRP